MRNAPSILRTSSGRRPMMLSMSASKALNSEGFCERMLRCAGHVLTEGNTLLKSKELEKPTLLRMNRQFMRFMRKHYGHVSQQQFNLTLVEGE